MHYYIDAYNLLFRFVRAGTNLEEQRRRLIEDIESKASALKLHLTLIFDGSSRIGPGSITHYLGIEIVFSDGESADDCLISRIKHEENPRNVTLVTSDGRLAWRARRLGAKTEPVETFIAWLNTRNEKRKKLGPVVVQRKLNKPETPPPKTPEPLSSTQLIPSSPSSPPLPSPSVQKTDLQYYLETFEQRFRDRKNLKED